jgi:hypothetical protein
MTASPEARPRATAAGCALMASAVFVVDVLTPREVTEPCLYAVVVFVSLRSPSARLSLAVAAGSSALTAAGFFLSSGGPGLAVSLANRGIALLGIWMTYALGEQRRRLLRERERLVAEREAALTKALSQFIPICAWCKKVRGEGGGWQELESYVEEKTESRFTHGICPACTELVLRHRGG